jgi:hypothetical protein
VSVEQGQGRFWKLTPYVGVLPGHDLVLTRADVERAGAGSVFSIEAESGPESPAVAHLSRAPT